MNIPRILLTQIVALAFQELDGMNDHTSAEATAKAISAAEEENGEAIRRIMSQVPDLPVAAFPLVSMAYAMAALASMGKCQGACWVACRTYGNKLMAMMSLPAPDSDGYREAVVDFLERHQDQLLEGKGTEENPATLKGEPVDPMTADTGDTVVLNGEEYELGERITSPEPHPVKANRGPRTPEVDAPTEDQDLARAARHMRD